MKECKKYKEMIIKHISSSLSRSDMKQLELHANNCPDCGELLKIHQNLNKNKEAIPLPQKDEFRVLRQNVIRKIRISQSQGNFTYFIKISEIFKKTEFAYALAVIFLIFGLYGFFNSTPAGYTIPSDLIEQIDYSAQHNNSFTDIANSPYTYSANSPYTYSNVEIQNMDNRQIRLGFNVSTYVELTRKKDDPLVKEILAQSIINTEQTGSRLNTISYAEDIIDPKLKETLIYVLHNDPVVSVRLKALNILTKYTNDNEIQKAFLKVLKREESVQMRLTVLEYLMSSRVDANLIVKELGAATTSINEPVLIKAQEYINYSKKSNK